MPFSLDPRPDDTICHVNLRTTENEEFTQDSCIPFSIFESSTSDQTLRKELYFEDDNEDCTAHEHMHQINSFSSLNDRPVIPRVPTHNWNLKLFLVELSKEVTDEDLDIVKYLLTGTEDDGKNLHDASKLKVFDLLQTSSYITSRDLLYLQVILAVVGKDSLINKVYQYAQNTGNILHFDPPLKGIDEDNITDISVAGVDFRFYTEPELDEFCNRIRRMVSVCHKTMTSCKCGRVKLSISTLHLENNFSNAQIHESDENECMDFFRGRHCIVKCDIGIQTEVGISDHVIMLNEENERLKEQLLDAEHALQKQSNEMSAMRERLNALEETRPQLSVDNLLSGTDFIDVVCRNVSTEENTGVSNLTIKDIRYELNGLKKTLGIKNMAMSSLSEKCEGLHSKYEEAITENKELRIEKTNTDIQVAILQRNLDDVEAKLKKRIEKENCLIEDLRNKLAMTTASLLNAHNDKRLNELTRLLEQISSMSMTVKKVYGNFDPAHDPISPEQDELFRKSLSGKIGRIFPQIYYAPEKR